MNLQPIPLTRSKFAAFGEVIELQNAQQISINDGLTTRFHDLLSLDTGAQNGRTLINLFRTEPLPLPHKIIKMERHPLGSQAFLPLQEIPFLVLVGRAGETLSSADLTLFKTDGKQGINLYKNTWHHFQIVLNSRQDFLVIDRGGDGENLQEIGLTDEAWIGNSPQDFQR